MSLLTDPVFEKISELGTARAADFFSVSEREIVSWTTGVKDVPLSAAEQVFNPEMLNERKLETVAWEGQKLAILLPFYKTTCPETSFSIMALLDRTKMAVLQRWGDAFIIHSRNALADDFVRSGIENSLWIDDDMVVPFGDAEWFKKHTRFALPPEHAGINLANRLMSHGKSLVGGLYVGRNKSRRPMFSVGPERNEAEYSKVQSEYRDEVIEVNWVATGAMFVSRQVYLDIQARFPSLMPQFQKDTWHYFSNSETDLSAAVETALKILNDTSASEESRINHVRATFLNVKRAVKKNSVLRQGEDVTFCKRAREAGHIPHVDLGAICGHIGNYTYGPRCAEQL